MRSAANIDSINDLLLTRTAASRAQVRCGYMLVAPSILLIFVLIIVPVVAVSVIATTDWQFGASNLRFVGARNFIELLTDPHFRSALKNTLLYTLMVVPGTFGGGLLVALLIESDRSLRTLYRGIHFLPFIAAQAAMAIVWEALLHPTIGLVNQMLAALSVPTANWLRNEATVLPVLALIGIWQNLGFAMVLFLAGLKAIPSTLYDAAAIDGADSWLDRFRTVTFPLLAPVSIFVFIVVALRGFEVFDTVQILTQGGPGHASEVLLFSLFRESFQYMRTGYGAAMTLVFLSLVIILTTLQEQFLKRRFSR